MKNAPMFWGVGRGDAAWICHASGCLRNCLKGKRYCHLKAIKVNSIVAGNSVIRGGSLGILAGYTILRRNFIGGRTMGLCSPFCPL